MPHHHGTYAPRPRAPGFVRRMGPHKAGQRLLLPTSGGNKSRARLKSQLDFPVSVPKISRDGPRRATTRTTARTTGRTTELLFAPSAHSPAHEETSLKAARRMATSTYKREEARHVATASRPAPSLHLLARDAVGRRRRSLLVPRDQGSSPPRGSA